jgi:hypothetical protein
VHPQKLSRASPSARSARCGGPGAAPPLPEWLGEDITTDLGACKMEDMRLVEKLVRDVPVEYVAGVSAPSRTCSANNRAAA